MALPTPPGLWCFVLATQGQSPSGTVTLPSISVQLKVPETRAQPTQLWTLSETSWEVSPQAGQGPRAPGHRTFLSTFPSHQLASPEGSCSTSLELVACSVPLSNPRPPAHLGVE